MTDTSDISQKALHARIAAFIGQTLFMLAVLAVAVLLVRHYYHGENGQIALTALKQELAEQTAINAHQMEENARLRADINDLKTGLVATEEHARVMLGLIKPNEIFVQVLEVPRADGQNQIPMPTDERTAVEVAGMEVE